MLERLIVRAHDLPASQRFYETVLPVLGRSAQNASNASARSGDAVGAGPLRRRDVALAQATGERGPTRGLHLGFGASSREQVDAFWQAGVDAGYRDDGAPGPRPVYTPAYYGGFLLDPDGNSVEAVHHEGVRPPGALDHVWMRVRDLAAARSFYEPAVARAQLRLVAELPERIRFAGAGGPSLSLVEGTPSEHVTLTFRVSGDPAVDVDPDGNVVELVS